MPDAPRSAPVNQIDARAVPGPPPVATRWQLRQRTLALPSLPLLMGIVNVTPDSFSDGGQYLDPGRAVEHGRQLVAEGAALLDVGGESTRPGSRPVAEEEELRRVIPVIRALAQCVPVPLSVDTSKARVAAAALDAGAEVINDVTGLTGDAEMVPLAARSGAGLCVMHMQGRPATMQDQPTYADVVAEVFAWLRERRDALVEAGIDRERICVDVGLGFGKEQEHNLQLLQHMSRFHQLHCPLLVGHSRKSLLGKMLADEHRSRYAANLGVALAMARHQVQILRVHDVGQVHEALLAFDLAGGCGP